MAACRRSTARAPRRLQRHAHNGAGRASTSTVRRLDRGRGSCESTDPSGATVPPIPCPTARSGDVPGRGARETETGPDPRWDYAVPTLVAMKVATPAGRVETTTHTSAATLTARAIRSAS